ncbi:MAG: hydrogenase expression/formation protein [Gammaproteobacteria bacterium]|nr:MAG: hydrogenase expression/formation protein [Gammaproteobacteria bacterium]
MVESSSSIANTAVTGPGSQPADTDGAEMTFMDMPSGMTTFEAPMIPEVEEVEGLEPAIAMTEDMLKALQTYRAGEKARVIELDHLDDQNRIFYNQLLGNGEVSVQCNGSINARIQESVLAGVWRVQYTDEKDNVIHDTMEIAGIPGVVSELAFDGAAERLDVSKLTIPEDVYNAAPLLAEISDKLPEYETDGLVHVINLSLLPHTEEDIKFLSNSLGIGPVIILSRGYGNCRISSTKTKNVWWVQYFNSQDTLILNTLEISKVPEVACASQEDLEDSAERLDEILEIYR